MASERFIRGPMEYVSEVKSLDRVSFEKKLRSSLACDLQTEVLSELRKADVQVLFEISDRNRREFLAMAAMKKEKAVRDWRKCKRVAQFVEKHLGAIDGVLSAALKSSKSPQTSLFANSVRQTLSKVEPRLRKECKVVLEHQRISEAMMKALSPKVWRYGFIAEIENYIDKKLPRLKATQKDALIGTVMSAAQAFTEERLRDGVTAGIPTERSRAKGHIGRSYRSSNDGPVFQIEPQKDT